MTTRTTTAFSYDAEANLMRVSLHGVQIRSHAEVDDLFDRVGDFWKNKVGIRAYVLVDYSHFSIDKELIDHWGARLKQAALAHSLAVVRFSNDSLVRTVVKTAAMKVQMPSNMFASADEALQAIEDLKNSPIAAVG